VSALQLDMIRQLCRVYDKDFSESSGKAIITSLTSSIMARAGARSLIKLIPGIGTLVGGVAVSIFNGASTYALGQVFKRHFDSGGTILDFDTDRLKKMYNEQFEKGKKVAEQLRKEQETKTEEEKAAEQAQTEEAIKAAAAQAEAEAKEAAMEAKKVRDKEILDRLKEAADLKDRGILSDEEFEDLKKRLLSKFDE
ncbi:MAG: SHOCT domain-containing protein, partial [Bacteroidota bacterium]